MDNRRIEEVSEHCGVPSELIIKCLREEWIIPVDSETPVLDQEDEARVRLIWELHSEFGVNDEAMPIILHLIDQLNRIHLELKKYRIH